MEKPNYDIQDQTLIPHLFRTSFGKITAVLSRHFGIEHLKVAEDIASESFLAALDSWPYKGIPENPVGWLYQVAKNKAINYLQRQQMVKRKLQMYSAAAATQDLPDEPDLSEANIRDSQLQMLFTLCQPSIPVEAQVGLSLRILCGFGIDEIASALLSNKETINKRLYRAREKLRQENFVIGLPSEAAIEKRLETVLATLYLLFSEGYYSETNDEQLREELCAEAMRLNSLLLQNPSSNTRAANALYALMCFQASRFGARRAGREQFILYANQDAALWNKDLIAMGALHLHRASTGNEITHYHLEAGIAYWHTIKEDTREKWEQILLLYDALLLIAHTPIAALNRVYALAKLQGAVAGIAAAEALQLKNNHYYFTLLGELYTGIDRLKARSQFQMALSLAKTRIDRQLIMKKLTELNSPNLP